MLKSVFIPILIALSLSNCSSPKTKTTVETPELQKILEGHRWQITSITSDNAVDFNSNGVESKNIRAQNNPCTNDDVFFLKANQLLILEEGEIICQERDNNEGNWSADNFNLTLKLPQTASITFKVVSFNKKEVKVKSSALFSKDKNTLTYTLTQLE